MNIPAVVSASRTHSRRLALSDVEGSAKNITVTEGKTRQKQTQAPGRSAGGGAVGGGGDDLC